MHPRLGYRNVSVRPLDAICDLMNVRLAESDVVKFLRAAMEGGSLRAVARAG